MRSVLTALKAGILDDLRQLGLSEKAMLSLDKQILGGRERLSFESQICFTRYQVLQSVVYFTFSQPERKYIPEQLRAKCYPLSDPGIFRTHTFNLSYSPLFSQKEIFNLFEGRYVHRHNVNDEGLSPNSWYYLERTNPKTGQELTLKYMNKPFYNLGKLLPTYPIAGIENLLFKRCLILSLKKGNLQPVTFVKTTKTEFVFMEAYPASSSIGIHSWSARMAQWATSRKEKPADHSPHNENV